MNRGLWSAPGVVTGTVLVATLLAWEIAARLINMEAFPPASVALAEIPGLLADPEALGNIAVSLARMLIGFVLACLIAVPLGLTMAHSRVVEGCIKPLLLVFYPVPKAALMPLIMLWIGVGDASKILVIFLGASLPLIYHATEGGRSVDEKLIWSAQAMGMGPVRRLFRIVLWAALPQIVLGARTGLAMALIVMLSAEMIARENGVGDILFNALDMAVYPTVYATIVLIAAIGSVIDVIMVRIQRHVVGWAVPVGSVFPQS